MKHGIVRSGHNRPSHQLDRACVVPLLVMENTQQVHGLGVPRLARELLLVQPGRLPQLTSLMGGHRGLQKVVHGRVCPETSVMLHPCR